MEQQPVSSLPTARARAFDIAAVVDRLTKVEEWLASGITPRHAVSRALKPPPVGFCQDRRTATRYVSAALARLQQDSTREPIESKRARLVAMLHAQIERALNQERTFCQNGETVTYPCADLKAANQAISLLAQIEGLSKGGI